MGNTRIRAKRFIYSSGVSGENIFFRVYNPYEGTWLDASDGKFKALADVVEKNLAAIESEETGIYSHVEQRESWIDHDYLVVLYIDNALKLSRLMEVVYDVGVVSFSKTSTGEVTTDVNVVNTPSVAIAGAVTSRLLDALTDKLQGITTDEFVTVFDLDMSRVDSIGLTLKNVDIENLIAYEIVGRKSFSGDVEIFMWGGNLMPNEIVLKDLGARYGRLQVRVKSASVGLSSAWKLEAQYLRYIGV